VLEVLRAEKRERPVLEGVNRKATLALKYTKSAVPLEAGERRKENAEGHARQRFAFVSRERKKKKGKPIFQEKKRNLEKNVVKIRV